MRKNLAKTKSNFSIQSFEGGYDKNYSYLLTCLETFSSIIIDASLEFSQCMREQGVDFPDPTPGEFGFFAFRDADVDWTSDEVQSAFEVCQPENPLDNLDD